MAVTMLIQYRADKARLFNIYQEDAERYLAGFLGDDLRTLGLPMPHECVFKSWRTGFVLCNWDAADGSVCLFRSRYVSDSDQTHSRCTGSSSLPSKTFADPRGRFRICSCELSYATSQHPTLHTVPFVSGRIELHDGGSRTVASAPFAYKRQKKASAHTRDVPAPGPGKAPTAPKSTLLARHASSPLARPMAPSHQYHTNHFVPRFHGEADSSTDERSAAPKETPSSTGLRPDTAAFSAPASGVGFASRSKTTELPAATANGTTSARPQGFVVPKVEEESHDAILHSSPPALKRPSQESPRRGLFPPPSASYAFAKSSRSSPSPSRASHGSSASSMFSARSSATSMSSISTTASDVGTLMREVWDVRREMAALRAREAALVQRLEQGNARPGEVPLRARERPWTSEGRGMRSGAEGSAAGKQRTWQRERWMWQGRTGALAGSWRRDRVATGLSGRMGRRRWTVNNS
ncbi:uncharacterized protein B0H18DRAFT_1031139 [Fomitopsis serialis]|uniref:uncharacterized protein n=1 Tax=Fomitopsis serialis TaxID=139415 RepID=UPI0020074B69|nr:uncharacterized protein B0H18DRAFT_1031139 [Neoantrodia serialis]KAH9918510.1 hypothetical protein B0H18DRAFT_1031139 [Neoantrodia serialis]